MAEDRKDELTKEKGFGKGIEVVKDAQPEEKDIEINFGKVFSFFKGKKGKSTETVAANEEKAAASAAEYKAEHKAEHKTEYSKIEHRTAQHGSRGSEATAEKKEEEKEEAEIDIGKLASGIRGFFKGKKEEKEMRKGGSAGEGDEVSLDLQSISDLLRRKGSAILLILGILIVVGLTANVRLQPSQLHFTEDWAKNSVDNTIQSDIQAAISEQYPNLPDARKSQILAGEMDKARKSKTYVFKAGQYKGQQIDIKNQIKGTAEFIKDFYRDENGRPYSPDIDPYYWNRYAKNIVESGHIGDEIKNGVELDNHQVAPLGRGISPQDYFFPYFIAYLYKFVRFFDHSITLWEIQTTTYSVLFTSLTALLLFFIGRKIAGNVGGFFGALMASLHVAYVNRTIHGDNDQVVIFFAVVSVWLFVQAIHEHKTIMRIMLALFAGFAVALYSMAWGGWWFIFLFILTAAAAAILVGTAISLFTQLIEGTKLSLSKTLKLILARNVGKRFIMPTAVFFFSTAALITLFTGFNKFLETPLLALGVQTLKSPVVGTSFWPNVLTTVAELNEGNFDQVVSSITPNIFWLSLFSAAMLTTVAIINFGFLKNKLRAIVPKEEKALYSVFFATLVVVWFVGTIYASMKGIRFVLLLVPIAGLGFGATLGLTFKLVMWINENFLKINKTAVAAVVFIILATATYSTDVTKKAYSIANNDVPIINDAWYGSLTAIRDDSEPDAIITSWWDFGHHFKSITDRKVTFDGTTQQYPPAHWVGKFFMTKNETEAAGILRMLDCGSTKAFDELYKVKDDFAAAIKTLYRLTATISKHDAKTLLIQDYNLTEEQAENVLKYTHCTPPEAYVIASEDMIGKSGVWGHFGSWDFERGIIWQTLKGKPQKEAVEKMKEMFNYSEEKAKAIYGEMIRIKDDREANSWIAPWPSFSGEFSGCRVFAEEGVVRCNNGLMVNLTTNDAYFPVEGGKVLHPVSFVYMTNESGTEEAVERAYTNDTIPQRFSTILVPQGQWLGNNYESYYSAVASPEQAAGMFTRMFLFEGRGLKHFKLLTHQRGLTGTNVYVYKADWVTLLEPKSTEVDWAQSQQRLGKGSIQK